MLRQAALTVSSGPIPPEDVKRLRGSVETSLLAGRDGGEPACGNCCIHEEDFVNALGALSGNQAMQMVRAGLKAIYLSGWQVAADANTASAMYPDQSLYPANAGPELAKRINRTLQRADQIETSEDQGTFRRNMVCADRCRCRSRLRRTAQCLRDHEGLYRSWRCRCPLRGPAGIGKEVRPSRRQGADSDCGPHPQSERGAACRGRHGGTPRSSSPARMRKRQSF